MKIFADCASFVMMQELADHVLGFTTNPTLMHAAGVREYEVFARKCVEAFPEHSLSFEVIADDLPTMCDQARKIATWGSNVVVKIPISTTDGTPTYNLIWELQHEYGVNVNVTAVFTIQQVETLLSVTRSARPDIVSIFAGRIADTGRDPAPIIQEAVVIATSHTDILWASAREVFNVKQAFAAGAHIITLTPDLLQKYAKFGQDLTQRSRETVKMFYDDALAAGLTL